MTTQKPPLDSKSTSQSIEEALDKRCLHCAIALFMTAWHVRHGDKPYATVEAVIECLTELLADVVVSRPDKKSIGPLALQAMLALGENMNDVLFGRYKSDEVESAEQKNQGGLH